MSRPVAVNRTIPLRAANPWTSLSRLSPVDHGAVVHIRQRCNIPRTCCCTVSFFKREDATGKGPASPWQYACYITHPDCSCPYPASRSSLSSLPPNGGGEEKGWRCDRRWMQARLPLQFRPRRYMRSLRQVLTLDKRCRGDGVPRQ